MFFFHFHENNDKVPESSKMVPKKAQIWIRYRKCRDKATDTQSQGDPKIVKRGPNFERKGDQKGTFFDVKGDPKFDFFQNCSQRANMLKWSRNRINFFLEMFDFHMQNHILG